MKGFCVILYSNLKIRSKVVSENKYWEKLQPMFKFVIVMILRVKGLTKLISNSPRDFGSMVESLTIGIKDRDHVTS